MGNEEGSKIRNFRSLNKVKVVKYRRLGWVHHVARRKGRSAFRILTGISTGNRPLGRPKRRWEDFNRIDLKEKVSISGI